MVGPKLKKQNTVMRESISPEERLAATLRFLATGRSYEDLKFSTLIAAQTLGRIIPETCQIIFETLKDEYMKVKKFQSSSMDEKRSGSVVPFPILFKIFRVVLDERPLIVKKSISLSK